MSTRVDVVDDRRCRQDCGRRAVPQRRGDPFVVHAELRHGQRDRDEAGLHRAENPDDVFEALRSKDRGAITRRSAGRQLPRRLPARAVDLRPRQGLGIPGRIDFVVDERVRGRIRLLPDLFA